MHSLAFAGNEWFSNYGSTTAQVTYDLGSVKSINALALWNEETSGIGTLALTGSADGVTFNAIGTYMPIDNPLANYPAQVFSFAKTSVEFVRFGMSDCPQPNPGSYPSCAIGEVAFRTASGTVPEPAAWTLMIAGFGLVGAALRRRAPIVAA
ncbi:PEPxxWA-CTERM sorting domain-containing protein (plasmid) [Polymorphobacter megasporae]|nr:PEPxxWA-CTERM sorting domain-containing protein [Polymorphobacter megasporae]